MYYLAMCITVRLTDFFSIIFRWVIFHCIIVLYPYPIMNLSLFKFFVNLYQTEQLEVYVYYSNNYSMAMKCVEKLKNEKNNLKFPLVSKSSILFWKIRNRI